MYNGKTKQEGAVLGIALVMLLVLTIIGFTAMRTSSTEIHIGNNSRDLSVSFQAAESAMREAEDWLINLTEEPLPVSTCAAQPCVITKTSWFPDQQTHDWWVSSVNSAPYTGTALSGVATQPRYVVEFDRFVADELTIGGNVPTGTYFYRVTTRGTGGTDSAQSILQSTFARRF